MPPRGITLGGERKNDLDATPPGEQGSTGEPAMTDEEAAAREVGARVASQMRGAQPAETPARGLAATDSAPARRR